LEGQNRTTMMAHARNPSYLGDGGRRIMVWPNKQTFYFLCCFVFQSFKHIWEGTRLNITNHISPFNFAPVVIQCAMQMKDCVSINRKSFTGHRCLDWWKWLM
jgi:hypothetical protein